uniref:Uncharacterized protein n=1 Tax=Sphaerodactylus townsendi TaxID=933632 RepID=A0ACB8FMU9_9SAUR
MAKHSSEEFVVVSAQHTNNMSNLLFFNPFPPVCFCTGDFTPPASDCRQSRLLMSEATLHSIESCRIGIYQENLILCLKHMYIHPPLLLLHFSEWFRKISLVPCTNPNVLSEFLSFTAVCLAFGFRLLPP